MNENESFFDELKKDVDADHRRIDGADAPPANMWNAIRAQTKPDTNEERKMIASNLMSHAPTPVATPVARKQSGVRHTLSLAASFLIVMSVALAGWFATMQLNQPGGSNDQFGLFGQMDESATCDVEPMTVDEVMEVVKNPYSTFEIPYEMWVTGLGIETFDELFEPKSYMIDRDLLSQETSEPDARAFTDASSRMNEFLGCTQAGSVSQIFRFMIPIEIQRIVLSSYPVFREEAQVREGVEELLSYPAYRLVAQRNTAIQNPELIYYANPNQEDAGAFSSRVALKFDATQMILFGTTVVDADGEIVFQNNASGYANPVGPLKTTDRLRVLMVQPRFDDEWYVLATIPE